jgi:hypothetical protein
VLFKYHTYDLNLQFITDSKSSAQLLPEEVVNFETVISILKKRVTNRTERDILKLIDFFKENKFFADFLVENGKDALMDWYRCLKYQQVKQGNYVMKQGDYGDVYYIILKGSAAVLVNMETPFEWRCEPSGTVPEDQVDRGIKDFIG